MPRRFFPPIWGGVLAIALLAPASVQAACPDQNTQAIRGVMTMPRVETSVHCLINEERVQRGLPRLDDNGKLDTAATGHSSSMRWNRFFSHVGKDGSTFTDRIVATGYIEGAEGWFVGENIAWGSDSLSTPKSLVIAWMNSPAHRENILDSGYNDVGVGAVWGSPIDPWKHPATIVTTNFGYVESTPPKPAKAKRKGKRKEKPKRKRKRRQR